MDKKTFDFNSEIKKLFSDNKKLDVQVRVAGVADTLFCVAHENAGKKFDIVFTESDYLKFSKIITGALKRACAEFSLLLIEDKDFDHVKNKSFFNFNGDIVIVGNKEYIYDSANTGNKWIELGDTTEEGNRISAIEKVLGNDTTTTIATTSSVFAQFVS